MSAAPPTVSDTHAMITSSAAVEGERKQVTVLFADISRSTERVSSIGPHAARRLLDPALHRMMDAIHHHGGTVNQVMGDGVMALFGAPFAQEDHALRACHAALRIKQTMTEYSDDVLQSTGDPIQTRVGVHSGEAVVRSMGNNLHVNYTAMGLTTHVAARLENLAEPGAILITAATLDLVDGYVAVKPVGSLRLKGVPTDTIAYELLGATGQRSRFRAAAARGMSRFVGRRDELGRLRQALEQAGAGSGRVVAISGEPGVGKSRLIHEFAQSRLPARWRVLHSNAAPYVGPTSYLPIAALLRQLFAIDDTAPPALTIERITARLRELDPALLPLLPSVLLLLDLTVDDAAPDPRKPRLEPRAVEAVKRVFLTHSTIQPLLVIIEDLHAIDEETQAIISGLAQALPTSAIMLVVSYRPDYHNDWSGGARYDEIVLDPLTAREAGELLGWLIGDGSDLDDVKQLLLEKTECNPFFLEESVRKLVETGVLTGTPGAYGAPSNVTHFQTPDTIEALLSSRIDRLAQLDKRVLLWAAVVGNPSDLKILECHRDFGPEEIYQALMRLQASGFLYDSDLSGHIQFSFKHALIQQVAYDMLPPDLQRALHQAALDAGEAIYRSDKADWLAYHALRAEAWDRAVGHLQTAATRAIRRAASRAATQHLENCLIAAEHLPTPERQHVELETRIALRHALTPVGQVKRTLEHLGQAERLAVELGDRPSLGRVVSFTCNCLVLQRRYGEALTVGARALDFARQLEDRPLELATSMYIARARRSRGEHWAAIALFREVAQALDEERDDDFLGLPVLPAATALSQLAASLAEVGAFGEAEHQARGALRRSEASSQPDSILWSWWSLGMVALFRGDASQAAYVFDRAVDFCKARDLDTYRSRLLAALGCAKARLGNVEEGLVLLNEAARLDAIAEPKTSRAFLLGALAEAALLANDLPAAQATATRLLDEARDHEERSAEAHAHWLLGTIRHAQGERSGATVTAFRNGATIAAELDLQPLLAHCHLSLGCTDDLDLSDDERRAHVDRGELLVDRLGMKRWMRATAMSGTSWVAS